MHKQSALWVALALVGKRVFYTRVMEDGKEYLHLTIE